MNPKKRVRVKLDGSQIYHGKRKGEPCDCGLHKSPDDPHVSKHIVQNKLEEWKAEIDDVLCVPDIPTSLAHHQKLFMIYGLVDGPSIYYNFYEWAKELVKGRRQFYGECIQMLGLCLRQTPIGGHPYLRQMLVQVYLKETGGLRFKKWLEFLLGAMHPMKFAAKKIKL